ncbi:hypothetical protein MP638_006396 [Amoeboaphelidium occidentale]|nr:hypothetical protein MP638_006396 [Amoeboaphelidium occidentale]
MQNTPKKAEEVIIIEDEVEPALENKLQQPPQQQQPQQEMQSIDAMFKALLKAPTTELPTLLLTLRRISPEPFKLATSEGLPLLHFLCLHAQLEHLQFLIAKYSQEDPLVPDLDVLVMTSNPAKESVLHLAVKSKNSECVKCLLELGVDILLKDAEGKDATDLVEQMRRGNEQNPVVLKELMAMKKFLLRYKENVQQLKWARDAKGRTYLHDAVNECDLMFIRKLLRSGFKDIINVVDQDGRSCLEELVKLYYEEDETSTVAGSEELNELGLSNSSESQKKQKKKNITKILRELLMASPDVDHEKLTQFCMGLKKDSYSDDEVILTIRQVSSKPLEASRKRKSYDGMDVEKPAEEEEAPTPSPVESSVTQESTQEEAQSVESLQVDEPEKMVLDAAESPKKFVFNLIKRDDGWSILHCLVSEGRLEEIQAYIEQKLPLEEEDNDGYTPLHVACVKGNAKIVRLLIDAGVNVNKKSKKNEVPLHDACENSHVECVEVLLNAKAETDCLNSANKRPVDLTDNILIKKMFNDFKQQPGIFGSNSTGNFKGNGPQSPSKGGFEVKGLDLAKEEKKANGPTTGSRFDDGIRRRVDLRARSTLSFQVDPMWTPLNVFNLSSPYPNLMNILSSVNPATDPHNLAILAGLVQPNIPLPQDYYVLDFHLARFFNYISTDDFFNSISAILSSNNSTGTFTLPRRPVTFLELKNLILDSRVCNYSGILGTMEVGKLTWVKLEDVLNLIFPLYKAVKVSGAESELSASEYVKKVN